MHATNSVSMQWQANSAAAVGIIYYMGIVTYVPSLSMIVTVAEAGLSRTSFGSSAVVSETGMVSSASQIRSSSTVMSLHCKSAWFAGLKVTGTLMPV